MDAAGSERQRIRSQIQRAAVGMLTTLDEHGRPAGRPMLPLLLENDPHIYFLTHQGTRKIAQLTTCPNVGLTFISDTCYVAVSGTASVTEDRNLVERLWNPTYRAWFPKGAAAVHVDRHRRESLRLALGLCTPHYPVASSAAIAIVELRKVKTMCPSLRSRSECKA